MKMMVDYYLSLQSPWTYLGHQRFVDLTQQHGLNVNVRPIDFSRVFPATGGLPLPKRSPQRQAYRMSELRRWRAHLNLPLTLEPKHFPAADRLAAGMVIALRESGRDTLGLCGAILRGVWLEERDIGDEQTLLAIAAENDLDGAELLEKSKAENIDATLLKDSEAAIVAGVFGAPTYAFENELFWGQDRLEFLARALAGNLHR